MFCKGDLLLFLNKKKLFELDNRLAACAAFVREGCKLADIGTDHAYLPIWLVKKGVVPKAIAADVKIGPLQKAAFHIRRYGVADRVDARLSDGLELIFPNEVDDVVIAGMGGLLIADVIENAPWLKHKDKHLILQPMTGAAQLRLYLAENGFAVLQECAVLEHGHIYTVMLVRFDPNAVQSGELFPYIGILRPDTAENRAYMQLQYERLQKRIRGLAHCGEHAELNGLLQVASQLEALLGE